MHDLSTEILNHLSKPIVMIGMMGSGKSHMGAALARALDLDFYDSDKEIEIKAGMSVAEVFEEFGEDKFRTAEHNTMIELLKDKGRCIIATGGGAVMNEKTMQALLSDAIVIWLDADIQTLWQRVQKSETRPLLQKDNPKAILEGLLESRRSIYEQAHIIIREQDQREIRMKDVLSAINDYL